MRIEATDLHFHRPNTGFSLRTPAFALGPGGSIAVRGPSGSGKSTLLALLSGELVPTQGTVSILGQATSHRDETARRQIRGERIGQVFQTFELVASLDTLQNVLLPLRLHGARSIDAVHLSRARALLERVGLQRFESRAMHALSHGERQRVAIARALLLQPAVVLADEPTGNLDPRLKKSVTQLLLAECARSGAALIVATHDESILPYFGGVIEIGDGA